MPLKSRGNVDGALQILANNFGLSRNFGQSGQSADGRGLAGSADDQGIAHGIQALPRRGRKLHADVIGTIVQNHRRRGGLALQHRARIQFHFLRSETRARGHHGIHVECHRSAARGVFDSILHIHDSGNLLDGACHYGRPVT